MHALQLLFWEVGAMRNEGFMHLIPTHKSPIHSHGTRMKPELKLHSCIIQSRGPFVWGNETLIGGGGIGSNRS